jgi:hypothetical protein
MTATFSQNQCIADRGHARSYNGRHMLESSGTRS